MTRPSVPAKASRYWSRSCPVFWVEGLQGRVGDYSYTTDSKRALLLTTAQQKRFAAYCKSVGVIAQFYPEVPRG